MRSLHHIHTDVEVHRRGGGRSECGQVEDLDRSAARDGLSDQCVALELFCHDVAVTRVQLCVHWRVDGLLTESDQPLDKERKEISSYSFPILAQSLVVCWILSVNPGWN